MAHPKDPSTVPTRRVRVRSRRLELLDEGKLATAFALLARRLLEQRQAQNDSSKAGDGGGRTR